MSLRKIIREEMDNLDWIKDEFHFDSDMVRTLLSNCVDVPIGLYNLQAESPYTRRGKPTIYYLSVCDYWWDRFKDLPLDENGRGKSEWFQDGYDKDTRVAVIMPDKDTTDIRNLSDDEMSAITVPLESVAKSLNGIGGELHFLVDDKGKPKYDLIPKEFVNILKNNYEKYLNESEDDFDWIRDIKPTNPQLDMVEPYLNDDRSTLLYIGDLSKDESIVLQTEIFERFGFKWHPNVKSHYRDDMDGEYLLKPFVGVTFDSEEHTIGFFEDRGDWDYYMEHHAYGQRTDFVIIDGYNLIKESDEFQWIRNQNPVTKWDSNESYVVDISGTHGRERRLAVDDILNEAENMDYIITQVDVNTCCYIYFESSGEIDWDRCDINDPTYGGNYTLIPFDEFSLLFGIG